MRNHGPDTVPRWCCLVCLALLLRHWTQQVQKMRLLFARNHALHPWTLSICVDVCSRRGCIDSIWLRVRKRTVSKPVFGVSKTSISGFVAVGPHCNWRFEILLNWTLKMSKCAYTSEKLFTPCTKDPSGSIRLYHKSLELYPFRRCIDFSRFLWEVHVIVESMAKSQVECNHVPLDPNTLKKWRF